MNAPAREEIDAKLETVTARLEAGLASVRQEVNTGLASVRQETVSLQREMDLRFVQVDRQFAEMRSEIRSEMHKNTVDLIKWMVGTAIAMSAAAITVMTFVLNYAVARPAAAPPAVQPQRAPAVLSAAAAVPLRRASLAKPTAVRSPP